MTLSRLLFIVLIVFGAWHWYTNRTIPHAVGVLASDDPVQINITHGSTFPFHGYQITPLAKFSIQARTLSVTSYYSGREADLSPLDFALGWGAMSDTAVLDKLSISQGNRFYYYHWSDQPPIPPREIVEHSANMHLIPANAEIQRKLKQVRVGDVVQLTGLLIRADAQDGWRWVSSQTRSDSGAGACEVVWVDDVAILPN
jgi:hypothetical protein